VRVKRRRRKEEEKKEKKKKKKKNTLDERKLKKASLSSTGTKSGEGSDMNALLVVKLDQVRTSVLRRDFELIHCWTNTSISEKFESLTNCEVRNPNRFEETFVNQLEEEEKERKKELEETGMRGRYEGEER
jgi:hypothetical protein